MSLLQESVDALTAAAGWKKKYAPESIVQLPRVSELHGKWRS